MASPFVFLTMKGTVTTDSVHNGNLILTVHCRYANGSALGSTSISPLLAVSLTMAFTNYVVKVIILKVHTGNIYLRVHCRYQTDSALA